MSSATGADPRPLRFVIFGESIVSDWQNPPATTWRPVLAALSTADQDATFLEQRRNRAVVGLLQSHGAAPVRSFADHHPDIHYRTYDLPSGAHRNVWFGREVATADVVILLDTAPSAVFEELALYDTPRILKVLHRTGHGQLFAAPDTFDLVLPPTWPENPTSDTLHLIDSLRQLRNKRMGILNP